MGRQPHQQLATGRALAAAVEAAFPAPDLDTRRLWGRLRPHLRRTVRSLPQRSRRHGAVR
jgi:hypothetical protein